MDKGRPGCGQGTVCRSQAQEQPWKKPLELTCCYQQPLTPGWSRPYSEPEPRPGGHRHPSLDTK